MTTENANRCYIDREAHVHAQQYDGGFDLDFLSAAEQVRAAQGGQACEIIGLDGKVKARAMNAWFVRHSDGHLTVIDGATFARRFEPLPRGEVQ